MRIYPPNTRGAIAGLISLISMLEIPQRNHRAINRSEKPAIFRISKRCLHGGPLHPDLLQRKKTPKRANVLPR